MQHVGHDIDATCRTQHSCNMSDTTTTGTHQQSEGFSLVEQCRLQALLRFHLLSPLQTANTTCTCGVCHKECVTIQWWHQQDVHANAWTSSYTTRRRKGAGRTWAECPLMTAACACLACCTCAVSTSHRMFHSLNMPVKVSQHTEWGILPPLTERGQRNRCEQRHARKAVGSEASRKESRIMSHES